MKITHIETIALSDPGKHHETIVRVQTDKGLSGIGQAESPSLIIDAIIHCHDGLEAILRGEDPTQVERLWQKMYNRTGRGIGAPLDKFGLTGAPWCDSSRLWARIFTRSHHVR